MTAMLWLQLCKQYKINIKFFSTHHPETDSQIKSANKVIRNYLCVYIAYTHNDWVNHLPIAEFAASNYVNALISVTLFFADHSFYPQTSIEPSGTYKRKQKAKLLAANKIICKKEKMIAFLQDQLARSQDEQT